MEASARVDSQGRLTIPRNIRDALGIKHGDQLLFRVEDRHVTLRRIPDFLELAGPVDVPLEKRGTPWDEVLRETWRIRAAARAKAGLPEEP
ncbi:MAG: AbrB/MazE/SpoVT family DNA-binding domain-containing protein [Chloroflexota bacterium]|nr:AbrB/MazE/SpoVT family DNA-binding domain-containing protein [Chloroflexota bacterium]